MQAKGKNVQSDQRIRNRQTLLNPLQTRTFLPPWKFQFPSTGDQSPASSKSPRKALLCVKLGRPEERPGGRPEKDRQTNGTGYPPHPLQLVSPPLRQTSRQGSFKVVMGKETDPARTSRSASVLRPRHFALRDNRRPLRREL